MLSEKIALRNNHYYCLIAFIDFARGLEEKTQTDIIFLDFIKAINEVFHRGLLQKAYFYGIRRQIIILIIMVIFKCYFSGELIALS